MASSSPERAVNLASLFQDLGPIRGCGFEDVGDEPFDIIIVGAALSVAWESRQIRQAIRVSTDISARVRVPGGPEIGATTIDLSEGGTALNLVQPLHLPLDSVVQVALAPEYKTVWIDATVTRSTGGTGPTPPVAAGVSPASVMRVPALGRTRPLRFSATRRSCSGRASPCWSSP